MDKITEKPCGFGNGKRHSFSWFLELNRIERGLERSRNTRYYSFTIDESLNIDTGSGRMKIKFDRMENTKTNPNAAGKSYPICRVFGTALEGKMDGQEWSTQFFASARDMAAQVKEFVKGDIINVRLEKNGQFWNPTKFEKAGDEQPRVGGVQSNQGNAPVSAPVNPRIKNLEVAVNILGPKAKSQTVTDYLETAAGIADIVESYVEKKGMFQFDKATAAGIPDVDSVDEARID